MNTTMNKMKELCKPAIKPAIYILIFLIIVGLTYWATNANSFAKSDDPVVIVGDTIQSQGNVTEFEYNGHSYINIVKTDKNKVSQSYVMHSPSCKCTSRKLNNITTVITNNDNNNKESLEKRCVDNFSIIISKLNKLENDNKTLKAELASVKAKLNKPAPVKKPVAKKPVPNKTTPAKKVVKKK